jgi:alkylation response protein AidB-like acyl-CoA dehydrogenase
MAKQELIDLRDVLFVIQEVLRLESLSEHEQFSDFNAKTIEMIIKEARQLAIRELLPTGKEGDEVGCSWDNGRVTVPECFHKPFKLLRKGEWIAPADDLEVGGQGMPLTLSLATGGYFTAANTALMMYVGLMHGAGKLVETFGTPEQKELFLKKLYSGEWAGTMLLTEPEAGSDVGALKTRAIKNEDGTYDLAGEKIFISGGDHDLTKNIIHPVLARIEGAPAGTDGISLFLVPKIWVKEDGTLGEPNGIVCTGIEKKLGIHGSATCSMSLGSRGRCRGFLLGEENKGMRAMFLMMNEERLLVGEQALAFADYSYVNAVNYCRERVQGRHLLKALEKDAPSVRIIEHPAVRRRLLHMKAYIEGMRSLLFYLGFCFDRIRVAETEEEIAGLKGMIGLLTPIAKGYVSDRACEITRQGMELYGGYGYTKEFPQEQLLRDCSITPIYEGTNDIQAMDFLGRKVLFDNGRMFKALCDEIQAEIDAVKEPKLTRILGLGTFESKVLNRLRGLQEYLEKEFGKLKKVMEIFTYAHPFMEVVGDVVLAWKHLERARIAFDMLEKAEAKDKKFYEGQLKSAEYFFRVELPKTIGKMNAIKALNGGPVEIDEGSF